jgi:energy-coupling factor transport system permease protein
MEARCYRGGENRTRMKQLKYTSLDTVVMVVIIGFLAFCIYTRIAI